MGFVSFMGRVFFSAIFILAAWQKLNDFGIDGGPALKEMAPKLELFKSQISSTLGLPLPHVEPRYLLTAAIALEGLGGLLFTMGSSIGAYMLLIFLAAVTPVMHDFYRHEPTSQEFTQEFIHFLKNLSLFGALLFFLGMKSSTARQIARRRKQAPLKAKSS